MLFHFQLVMILSCQLAQTYQDMVELLETYPGAFGKPTKCCVSIGGSNPESNKHISSIFKHLLIHKHIIISKKTCSDILCSIFRFNTGNTEYTTSQHVRKQNECRSPLGIN